MKIKFSSDDDLLFNKPLELRNVVIVSRAIFHEGKKYYPQVTIHSSSVSIFHNNDIWLLPKEHHLNY